MPPDAIESFISRWENSGAAERANYQMFLSELCDIIEIPRPDPTSPDPAKNLYVFDRAITRVNPDSSSVTNYIDLYKSRHFVLETKQGTSVEATTDELAKPAAAKSGHGKRGSAAFDRALERAFHQGRGYITSLPIAEGRPPFLIVCDVGHSIDLYAEFSGTGGHYERFPDPKNHRILLTDLREEKHRATLRSIWTDPYSLDPSKKAAEVTRDIAGRLAKLAKSLEADKHDPRVIAGFLQRCLFTMFAEDIGLLPEDGFKNLLEKVKASPHGFPVLVSALWKEMATGTAYSALLFKEIACFNGGLFENTTALPLSAAQLAMLTDAAGTDWSAVEPSIFGTLLVRALDPRERHKLGAEFTPRSYVERLIRPTIIEPLRDEWDAVRIAAANLHREADAADDRAAEMDEEIKALGATAATKEIGAAAAKLRADAKKKDAEALKLVTAFHRHLCALKFLDPACGTANFLYVTLEHLKRLEAEVLELVTALGGDATFEMNEYKVRPEQFLGLELSHNAVAIAQLVLWIGYFQWQRKTTGKADTGDRPLLPKTQTIRQQDAVLAYDEKIPRRDPVSGEILTLWNGYTTKTHPVTGKEVPDESATIALFDYKNPRRAEWPQANYIVGNPPFIGNKRMRNALGDGYTEALRKAWKGSQLESTDFVMFWWQKAAAEVMQGRCKRFGFITTNSITQPFNRSIIESILSDAEIPLHLAYAIPDHPWVDSADGAAVRIALTVAAPGKAEGILEKVITEQAREDGENEVSLLRIGGTIAANLQTGADVSSAYSLKSNQSLASQGANPLGLGFRLTQDDLERLNLNANEEIQHCPKYAIGRDLVQKWEDKWVVDFFGLTEEKARDSAPSLYQHILLHVKPERAQNNRPTRRDNWWIFGENAPMFRDASRNLTRYIATCRTAKHRLFGSVKIRL
ncbi:MAG: DNA methyltransferase [Akkermansiaceae bacterium]